eukprot:671187-Pleurochrysis_carterae.AAC.2
MLASACAVCEHEDGYAVHRMCADGVLNGCCKRSEWMRRVSVHEHARAHARSRIGACLQRCWLKRVGADGFEVAHRRANGGGRVWSMLMMISRTERRVGEVGE